MKQSDSSNFSRSNLISVFSTEHHFRRSFGEEQIRHVENFSSPSVQFSGMKSNSYFRVICQGTPYFVGRSLTPYYLSRNALLCRAFLDENTLVNHWFIGSRFCHIGHCWNCLCFDASFRHRKSMLDINIYERNTRGQINLLQEDTQIG